MNERLLDEIRRRVEERYGSLSDPRFSFVSEAVTAGPYAGLMRRIASRFACEEDTDPNDDVSFGYALSDPSGRWILRLSMVGPFAVLLREGRDGALSLVDPDAEDGNQSERLLRSRLMEEGFVLVDRETLREPIALALGHDEPGAVTVYRALFTDTDVLPWEIAA